MANNFQATSRYSSTSSSVAGSDSQISPTPRRASERHGGGRPSRLTPEVRDRLLDALRTGNYRNVACRYAGISEATFNRWMTDPRPEFREFRGLVEQAEAEAEKAVAGNLVELSKRDYRAAIAWLERRAAQRWRLDDPSHDASGMYQPTAIAQEPSVAREPDREHAFSISDLPEDLIKPFVDAMREIHATGEVPAWVKRHEQELKEEMAGFYESSDDDWPDG
jgi:hypothetical protein